MILQLLAATGEEHQQESSSGGKAKILTRGKTERWGDLAGTESSSCDYTEEGGGSGVGALKIKRDTTVEVVGGRDTRRGAGYR